MDWEEHGTERFFHFAAVCVLSSVDNHKLRPCDSSHSDSFQHPGGPAGNAGFAVVSASVAATQKTVSTGTQCTPGGAWLTPGGP